MLPPTYKTTDNRISSMVIKKEEFSQRTRIYSYTHTCDILQSLAKTNQNKIHTSSIYFSVWWWYV